MPFILESLMDHDFISIKGANVNNLKNIDIDIPRNQLVVITGLSGSGKSSLAFDTLYAEGQRRYVESLSSYARHFMGRITKPNVSSIKGIPPTIAVGQRVISRTPRSTVGTTTEIYEYLKLLFARIGKTYSPISGEEVIREKVSDVLSYIETIDSSAKVYILAPFIPAPDRSPIDQLKVFAMQGFSRIMIDKQITDIDTIIQKNKIGKNAKIQLFIDRFKAENFHEIRQRIADSIETAFTEGKGEMIIQIEGEKRIQQRSFSNIFSMDGIQFEEPSPLLFSFNNPYGACKTCGGTGMVEDISPQLVFPDPSLSVFENGVACWRGDKMQIFKDNFIAAVAKKGFPIHTPINELSPKDYDLLWNGDIKNDVYGVIPTFAILLKLDGNENRMFMRILTSRFEGKTECPKCHGTRLRADANYVKIKGKSISDLVSMPINELYPFFAKFTFSSETEKNTAQRLISEITKRLKCLEDVGLGYLTLNRQSKSLSGGESQRITLVSALGSSLVGALYILDEPSIGLHSKDTHSLIKVLQNLRDVGNTIVVVEHDEDIIRAADYIIDIGPKAGRLGGEVVFKGTFDALMKSENNLTAEYIRGMNTPRPANSRIIALPEKRRNWRNYAQISGASKHNIKNITVKIPLDAFTVITGVSGSGKSTLIKDIVIPSLKEKLLWKNINGDNPVKNVLITKDSITNIAFVDQNPIGKSTRSNPATYLKIYDNIRDLFAAQPLAKQRRYNSGFFSFNVPNGRCETCEGEGVIHIEMQFLADMTLPCPDCNGERFKDEILDVKIQDMNIADILNMTINQAIEFFCTLPENNIVNSIIEKLHALQDVGLGYLKMGQPSSTLSGGEAQRIKLAYYLSMANSENKYIFFFDEPTTGLHFHDINKLYNSFNRLIEIGHTIVVIEHNPELIKCADWIIDLGPEGGEKGGKIVFQGKPEDIVNCSKSYTGKYLINKV